jgi:CheY-like chemotaxis protein
MTTQKILLIEDDCTMLSLLRTLLSFEGYEVLELDCLEQLNEIVAIIQKERPDLVLMDVNLHGFDGFEILSRIREDQQGKAIRVLMSSGMDFSERCQQAGADGFILKPYMPEDLIKSIRQALSDESFPE